MTIAVPVSIPFKTLPPNTYIRGVREFLIFDHSPLTHHDQLRLYIQQFMHPAQPWDFLHHCIAAPPSPPDTSPTYFDLSRVVAPADRCARETLR